MTLLIAQNPNIKNIDNIYNYLVNKYKQLEIQKKIISNTFEDSIDIANKIINKEVNRAIIFSDYGVEEFLTASKIKKAIVAPVVDEYTAEWTVFHNNTKIIIIPLNIVSKHYAIKLIDLFLNAEFEGGRHWKRINMLNILG